MSTPTDRRPPGTTPPESGPSQQELQQSLERLHKELAASSSVDASSRRLLREVLTDIERLLAHRGHLPAGAAGIPAADRTAESAPRRLRELAVEFEARHPLLAASARQFVDLLGRAGL